MERRNSDMFYMHRGQGPRECQCGAFVTLNGSEQEVLPFPPIDLEDCEDERRCSNLCEAEVMLYNFLFIVLLVLFDFINARKPNVLIGFAFHIYYIRTIVNILLNYVKGCKTKTICDTDACFNN